MKQVLVIGFIFLSFISQAKSNIVIDTDTLEVVNEQVLYKVFQDADNIHISVSTSDKGTIMTMLRRGVTVYFDMKGKKKKNVYVQYPKRSEKPGSKNRKPKTEDRPNFKEILEELPKQAFYKNFDIENQFHIGLNTLGIDLSFSEIERETLEYKLRIPKTNISSKPKQDFSKLLVGVILGGDRNDNDRKGSSSGISLGQQRGGGGRGGQGGPPSGGRSGGQGSSGGGRAQGGGKSPQGERSSVNSKAFWIDTNLKSE